MNPDIFARIILGTLSGLATLVVFRAAFLLPMDLFGQIVLVVLGLLAAFGVFVAITQGPDGEL